MDETTSALLAALDGVDLRAVAESVGDADAEPGDELSEAAQDQFLRAFTTLLREGLEGGREQRELVMETAVPAIVASGQTSVLELVAGHVSIFVALTQRLVEAVPEAVRGDACVWMARYAAEYTREVTERALAAEAGR